MPDHTQPKVVVSYSLVNIFMKKTKDIDAIPLEILIIKESCILIWQEHYGL